MSEKEIKHIIDDQFREKFFSEKELYNFTTNTIESKAIDHFNMDKLYKVMIDIGLTDIKNNIENIDQVYSPLFMIEELGKFLGMKIRLNEFIPEDLICFKNKDGSFGIFNVKTGKKTIIPTPRFDITRE